MGDLPFVEFPKVYRLNREVILTEKIDGTNASVHVGEDGTVRAGSRTRWVTPGDDNFGFAAWVRDNEAELRTLGPGTHYGEWWGQGIQRKYGLDHRRWSLFNVSRWSDDSVRPKCCHVVPVLGGTGSLADGEAVRCVLDGLREHGSAAAPGFMRPEGIVLFHVPSGMLFKVTLEKDAEPKGRGQQVEGAGR
jgi:RNA ligase-like protein